MYMCRLDLDLTLCMYPYTNLHTCTGIRAVQARLRTRARVVGTLLSMQKAKSPIAVIDFQPRTE